MRGTGHDHDHHPAVGLTRRIAGTATTLGLAAAILAWLPAAAAGQSRTEVRLPTSADALGLAPGAEGVLYGPLGVETTLPGPVSDTERVRVSIGPDGTVSAVEAVQRLEVGGLGDFSFKVPGPAIDVEPLPDSAAVPGLRRGAILWQGFSPGMKVLAARMHLDPELEAARLPIRFSITTTAGGRPVALGSPMTGPFEIVIRIENNTGFPASVTRGEGDPDELAPVLDGLAAALRRRERPRPGQGGIPEGVTALGPVTTETARVQMPVHVEGRVFFAASSASGVAAEGGTVRSGSAGPEVAFAATLGGGHPPSFEIRISGTAAGLGLPHLEAAAAPALPDPSVAQPPSASSWRALLAHHPGQLDGRDMLRRTFEVLWEVAGLRQLDAYVGNPDPNGPATTAFTFVLVRAAATQDGSPAVGAGELNALGLAAWILVLVALLFAAALAWANS